MTCDKKQRNVIHSKTLWITISFITSFLFITVFSKNSFLYAFNDWQDINMFLSIGKVMSEGGKLYQDIYDHKGPIWYMPFAIIQELNLGFTGIYLLELISFTLFLYITVKLLQLYTESKQIIVATLISIAAITVSSTSFAQGGGLEQLYLPFFAYGLYIGLKLCEKLETKKHEWYLLGAAIGIVFWSKFNLIAIFAGIYLFLLITCGFKTFLQHCIRSITGFLVITVPVICYLLLTDTAILAFNAYFFDSTVNYVKTHGTIFDTLKFTFIDCGLCFLIEYTAIALLVIYAIIKSATYKNKCLYLLSMFLFTWIGIFIGGRVFYYYYMPFVIFSILGIYELIQSVVAMKKHKLLNLCIPLFCIIFALLTSSNISYIGYEKDDYPQYQFAETIKENGDTDLLNYGFLDGGFYYAIGEAPNYRIFCTTNNTSKENAIEHMSYINEAQPTWVVTRYDHNHPEFYNELKSDRYERIESSDFVYETNHVTYYLYKRTD